MEYQMTALISSIEEQPNEDDLITSDHTHVYQYGKLVLTTSLETFDRDVRAHMVRERFWPNVWFVSDRGNTILIRVTHLPRLWILGVVE